MQNIIYTEPVQNSIQCRNGVLLLHIPDTMSHIHSAYRVSQHTIQARGEEFKIWTLRWMGGVEDSYEVRLPIYDTVPSV